MTATAVTGYVWQENVGWINLSPANYGGVVNAGGVLSGYGWSENVGWINFKPANGGVGIDAQGVFKGWAWGENIGWIHFSSTTPVAYKVQSGWVGPDSDSDNDGVDNWADNCPNIANPDQADIDKDSIGDVCDDCIDFDRDGYGNGVGCLGSDCDDTNSAVNPGAQELCNGIDDDCDGQTDEGLLTTYYQDADNDGYGNAAVSTQDAPPLRAL